MDPRVSSFDAMHDILVFLYYFNLPLVRSLNYA